MSVSLRTLNGLVSSDLFLCILLTFFPFSLPPSLPATLPLPAAVGRDGGHRGQGAGRADQRPPATRRRAIHGSGHGPTGRAVGLPAQEPHARGQGQRCPQPHQGTAGPVGADKLACRWLKRKNVGVDMKEWCECRMQDGSRCFCSGR